MKKTFDCVEMKHVIQQKILEEMRGLTAEEQQRRTEELINSDPVLARFWSRRQPAPGARSPNHTSS